MLILPLHRSLNRSNFPWLTLLLILANCFVFAFLQSDDGRVERQALDYYQQSDLGEVEFPAYVAWLGDHGNDTGKIQLMQQAPVEARIGMIESDKAFMSALHAGKVIAPTDPGYADWHGKRAEFQSILDSSFTSSHALRFSQFEPGRMLWGMFMHGGVEHIVGNMIFLAILGMLVEGALGPWWFLGLYLAGGIGAAFTTLALHWGEEGLALGASGAIAAVMGAYCVFWGSRKVRVFYWFFVVFDYVKVPALVLLPFWFCALVLLPLLSHDAYIDFDAHAGGILCGVAIAFGLRQRGLVRDAFIEEDERIDKHERNDAEFERAQQLIGQLEIPKAREILQRIDRAEPGQLRVLVGLYRCARYGGKPDELDAAAGRVLGFAAITDADTRELKAVYDDYAKACAGAPRLSSDMLMRLLPAWERLGDDATADSLLRCVAAREPAHPGLPVAWFGLALRTPDGTAKRRERMEYLLQHYPQCEYAPKARFLLGQG